MGGRESGAMRLIRGEVRYAVGNSAFGHEAFSVSVFPDGSRTLRALCRYDEGLTRDVVYTVGPDWRPHEAFVRVARPDAPIGSGWFRFTGDSAEAECETAHHGRLSQRIAVTERVRAFGSHPICSDIWRLAHVATDRIGEPQLLTYCMNSSPTAAGDTGPMLGWRDYCYVVAAAETIDTVVGPVACHRYEWAVRPGKTLRMWTGAPDFLPYRMDCPETGQRYDLTSLAEDG